MYQLGNIMTTTPRLRHSTHMAQLDISPSIRENSDIRGVIHMLVYKETQNGTRFIAQPLTQTGNKFMLYSWRLARTFKTGVSMCRDFCPAHSLSGEGELVSGVHTLVAGVVQVYHRLHVVEEEEKVRKVEQEVEREDQSEETAHTWMAMEMTWKRLILEPKCMCV